MANKNFKVRQGLEVGDNFTVAASTGNLTMGGDLVVSGNLTVNGTTTTLNTDVLSVEDNEIILNANQTGSAALDALVTVERGDDTNVAIKWNETSNKWQFTNNGSTYYDLLTADENTSYTVSAVDGTSGKKIIRLTGSDATTDDVTLVEGTGITLSRSNDEITITNSGMGTTYSISAETVMGGANIRLTGSDSSTDNLKIAQGTGITVTRTSADIITLATTITQYADSDARSAVSVTDAGGDGSLSYDSGTGVITYTGPSATEVRAHFTAGTGVTITSGSVAIGQAVGTSDAPSFAAVSVDGVANIDTATLTTSATTANQVLDSWSTSTYRSAKYQIQMSSGSAYQAVEMLVVQDGTGAHQTTYADVASGSDLATFSVDINSGNCRVLTTPANAATTYKIVRTAVVV